MQLAQHKLEGLATTLTFLDIEIDSVMGSLRLPQALKGFSLLSDKVTKKNSRVKK